MFKEFLLQILHCKQSKKIIAPSINSVSHNFDKIFIDFLTLLEKKHSKSFKSSSV